MEILMAFCLILFILLITGMIIYAYNIVPENDYDRFWASNYRFFVLIFYPFLILIGWISFLNIEPDFYNNFNKRRVIETIIYSLIGISGAATVFLFFYS